MVKRMDKNKIEITDNNFEKEVIEKSRKIPVVVDFWATWCMPCSILGPILEKLAKKYNGKLILAKLDIDQNLQISSKYEISAVPTVKFFKNGKVTDEFVGVLPENSIKKWLDKNLD
jgi:putative thioredoxin